MRRNSSHLTFIWKATHILFVVLTAFIVMEKFPSNGKCPEAMMVLENKISRKCHEREKAVEGPETRQERKRGWGEPDRRMLTFRISSWPQNLYICVILCSGSYLCCLLCNSGFCSSSPVFHREDIWSWCSILWYTVPQLPFYLQEYSFTCLKVAAEKHPFAHTHTHRHTHTLNGLSNLVYPYICISHVSKTWD